ncbi:tRNA (adenosine(37)-N6)-threonylcarbamoyltransferase complex ATPase subunit type 1 TsaE [Tepidamorphus sp. 3E244]|uniref:tRNA (adenosine(37)-N6)-threonylcarbamoyltransferase complex ATPase subunit type 1 TsaE n=1 Tax=Tepidamorphus sp. 3E244 TaxID=3385498 RepID=UPI0038FD076C
MADKDGGSRALPDEEATQALAREFALFARPGDFIALSGDLGAGKSTFARAFIRALAGDDALEVPSPTFTLVQTYDETRLPVLHCDLYRISDAGEIDELGLDEALAEGVVLVEWPDNAPGSLATTRLDMQLDMDGAGRIARFAPHGETWASRIARMGEISAFLDRCGRTGDKRGHLQGDASTRRYERLNGASGKAILMDSPARPDPGKPGEPSYSQIAHLAEDVAPFVALANGLRKAGAHAPEILAQDLDGGLLVIEDLGGGTIITADRKPIAERYIDSVRLLAHLHTQDLRQVLPVDGVTSHEVPAFDAGVFHAEASLLPQWYWPHAKDSEIDAEARADFVTAWDEVLATTGVLTRQPTWVLRDFHSPNVVWCEETQSPLSPLDRVGVIDFQDALWGPAAYDVVSLAQDARITVPPDLERDILNAYFAARDGVDESAFLADYAVMGAQRNTKILGIFARLNARDGKPHYLAHLPRVQAYLARDLAHPALAPVAAWFAQHLPDIVTERTSA